MTGPTLDTPFDATLTSRYECKYLVSRATADAMRRYLRPHVQLDPYSARADDHRYRVLSLYLDSPDLQLYRDTAQGLRNRYKLRLRYYAEEGPGPVFFEVKKRANIVVRKKRALVDRERAGAFLRHGDTVLGDVHDDDLNEFLRRCRESAAVPALRIRYWREAYESRGVDPVRITFDTEVQHGIVSSRGLAESRPDWRATPIDAPVIVELKFTDLRPGWVDQMLRLFQLDKVSVAKYAESIEHVRATDQLHALEASMGLAERRRRASHAG